MRRFTAIYVFLMCLGNLPSTEAQLPPDHQLSILLKAKDSLLFNAAFNTCDPDSLVELFTEDFEFYHDKSGATMGRDAFMDPFRKNCEKRTAGNPQPSKRILLENSLKVYPLYNNGELYGAIQQGIHRFEFLNRKQEYQKGDIARFTHVWLKQGTAWRIKRELSFDHQPSEPSHQSSSN